MIHICAPRAPIRCHALTTLHASRCRMAQHDIVFARCATRSIASKGRVGKLEYKFTKPWKIIEPLKGASYAIEHCLTPTRMEKKHASDLTPYPLELIPFKPIDGRRYLVWATLQTYWRKPVQGGRSERILTAYPFSSGFSLAIASGTQ